MSNLEIKHLFKFSRFPENDIKVILSIIYFPIGLVLFLLRAILALCLFLYGQLLPEVPATEKLLNKLANLSFGISVSVENPNSRDNVDVYVSNNISIFDQLAVHTAVGTLAPLNKSPLQDLPGLGIRDFGSMTNVQTFKKHLETLANKKGIPVHFCPEEKHTNGRALLKFNPKPFQFFTKVQPVCISIERPFLNISVSTVGSSYINDVLFFMYSPFTNYKLKFLPPLEKKSLSDEEFAEIVRQKIAAELRVEASNFSAADIIEWDKRRSIEERRLSQARSSVTRMTNPEIARMAAQVKEVLPHVPAMTIYNDLATTRSVDTTITNILEGRVWFVPESQPSASSTVSSSTQPSTSKSTCSPVSGSHGATLNTAASHFGKTASERTRSYQERKEQLIAEARRRYIEKHSLDIPF